MTTQNIQIGKIYDYKLDTVVKCEVKAIFSRRDGQKIAKVRRFSKYNEYGISNIGVEFLGGIN